MKPRQVEPQGPPLSAKGPFVKFDPADSKLSGNNHKKPLDNYYRYVKTTGEFKPNNLPKIQFVSVITPGMTLRTGGDLLLLARRKTSPKDPSPTFFDLRRRLLG